MPFIDYNGTQLEVDEDGFIDNPALWTEDLAKFIARTAEDIPELTEEHWKVIYYLNKYYKDFGIAPMVRKVCRDTGFDLKYIYELFPSGPAKGACKIGGLPKPTWCV
jgi:dissimilatory sulfite reductase related protein